MARILVVGMNPAWQTVLVLPQWVSGTVIRAREAVNLASGKGINCARLLARLGHDVTLMQTLAGERGKRCLDGCDKAGIKSLHIWVGDETRQCITLRDENDGKVTEVISPFAVDYQLNWGATLFSHVEGMGRFDALIILGSLPNGWPGGFYSEILRRVRTDLTVLDALQGLTLDDLTRAQWIKVNHSEWERYWGKNGTSSPPANSNWNTLITNGSDAARLGRLGKTEWSFRMPKIEALNPIGAGDTVTAGLTHFLLAGFAANEAVVGALAMGSASCLDLLPAHYQSETARYLESQIIAISDTGTGET